MHLEYANWNLLVLSVFPLQMLVPFKIYFLQDAMNRVLPEGRQELPLMPLLDDSEDKASTSTGPTEISIPICKQELAGKQDGPPTDDTILETLNLPKENAVYLSVSENDQNIAEEKYESSASF